MRQALLAAAVAVSLLVGCGGLTVVCGPGEYKIQGVDRASCEKAPGAACTGRFECLSWQQGGGCDAGVCSCVAAGGNCVNPTDCCGGQCGPGAVAHQGTCT